MPRANSGYVWLRNPRVQTLFAELAAGQVALDHAALDALPRSTTVEYIRGLLIATGLLPARDHYLAAFERWLDERLAQLSDREQHRLIDRYARWHLLRRLRQQARVGPVSQGAFFTAKQHTTVAIMLLAWLHEHGTTLPHSRFPKRPPRCCAPTWQTPATAATPPPTPTPVAAAWAHARSRDARQPGREGPARPWHPSRRSPHRDLAATRPRRPTIRPRRRPGHQPRHRHAARIPRRRTTSPTQP